MSFFRRAGALIARFFTSAVDPAAVAGEYKLYSKDDGLGDSQLYGRSDNGTVYQITPPGDGTLQVNNTWDTPLTADDTLLVGVTFVQSAAEDSVTLTLPSSVGNEGQLIAVNARVGNDGNVTLAAAGGDTIEGQATMVLESNLAVEVFISILLVSDGVNSWGVVADRDIVHHDATLEGQGTSASPLTVPVSSASWISLINALSESDVPIEWLLMGTPSGTWAEGDVVSVDFQLHSPSVAFSMFLAQSGTLITGSPVINGTSANPWTGRATFTAISSTEARMWGSMLTDSAGVSLEINVASPPATFTFDPSLPVQLMIMTSDDDTVTFDGTLAARMSTGATVSSVV